MHPLHAVGLAFALSGVAACGAARGTFARFENFVDPVHLPDSHVDAELLPHVADFRAAAAHYGRSLDEPDRLRVVLIDDPEERIGSGGEVGLCTQRRTERPLSLAEVDVRTVVILRPLVERPLALRRTVFHELGHCLLGLGHADARSHRSIMYPKYVGNSLADGGEWESLVAELFATQPP